MKNNIYCILFLEILCGFYLHAGDNLKLNPVNESIRPYLGLQLWNIASFNHRVDGTQPDDRYGSYFRRLRPGIMGKPIDGLCYNVMLYADYMGKDQFISVKGTPNTGVIKVWSAYITYKISSKNNWFHLSSGYMLPHMSRESATNPWSVSSLEKSESSCYLRRFVTGKNNGINSGLNMGGIGGNEKWSVLYNVAIMQQMNNGITQGAIYNPLLMGHCVLTLGDREFERYGYTLNGNELESKSYISFGFGVSYQGKSDFYDLNYTLSPDIKVKIKNWHFMSEYNMMKKELNGTCYQASNFLFRTGYNIDWSKKGILEPTFCFREFHGDTGSDELSYFDGCDGQLDAGINWWLSGKKLKLNLHYLHHYGNGKNNFSYSRDTDSRRGDLLALGFQLFLK